MQTILSVAAWGLAGAAAFFWLLLPGVFYLVGLWAAGRGGQGRAAMARHGRAAPLALRGWLDSAASTARISLTYPLVFLVRRRRAEAGQGPPLLLIHGLYHNPSAWLRFGRLLARAGFRDQHVYGYNSFTRVFEELVEEAAARARDILAVRPGARLVLVGHSLGGLVARAVAARPELAGRIGGLATLGTPYGGSILARIAVGRLGRQLRPDGPLFRPEAAPRVPNVPRLAVYTPLDNMVIPARLLLPPEGWTRVEISPVVSHVGMIYSDLALHPVLDFLADRIA